MKLLRLFFSFLFVIPAFTSLAMTMTPQAKMTVKVIDSGTGVPLTNATVQTRFLVKQHWDKADEYVDQQCSPNADGSCVLSNKDTSFGHGGGVIVAGYYKSSFNVPYTGINKILNRWEPWNPTIEVKMRQIKSPVRMMYQRVFRKKVPIKKGKIGFDLQEADWVAPYGQGKVPDLIFILTPVTEPKQGLEYSITFTNPTDGIQEYTSSEDVNSAYIFPYEAPTNGYVSLLTKYRLLKYPVLPSRPANNLKDNINYIFRVRTKVDKDGNIIEANYGRIQGEVVLSDTPLIDMQYWFNPDPHSRSLESDKKPY